MKPFEKLRDYILPLDYGTFISHKEIENIIGQAYGAPKYHGIVSRAQKALIEQAKALKSVRGLGYEVLKPNDYTNAAVREYQRGFRRLTAGENILISAPEMQMTEEGRRSYRDVSDKARILHASLAGGIVELKLLNKKHPLLPK